MQFRWVEDGGCFSREAAYCGLAFAPEELRITIIFRRRPTVQAFFFLSQAEQLSFDKQTV